MSRIFISHSSRNNAEALALQTWLEAHGWPKGEVFLDIDPEHGLVAGQRWVSELLKAAGRCEAVICAISPEWLASSYCRVELNQAISKGKAVFGVIVKQVSLVDIHEKLPELTSNYQIVDLSAPGEAEQILVNVPPEGTPRTIPFRRDGLIRLRTGLMKAGIDARSFAFDANRPIFPGLRALEEQDAAIFFGRDGKIVEGLDALRRSVLQDQAHVFCIVGASGSGKSSFLRAGLYPRLERDDRHWLPLPPLRPLKAILSGREGLYASLEKRFILLGEKRAQGELKQHLQSPDGFKAVIAELRRRAHSRMLDETAQLPTVVLPIDQGEELFETQQAEGQAFLELIAGVNDEAQAAEPPALVVLITIRSDNFEKLQKNEILAPPSGAIFSLPPLPKGTYKQVIEGPVHQLNTAREDQLFLDPKLVEHLLQDVSGESSDSLPLLAFVLESLLVEYGNSGRLTLAHYEASGRLQGAILAAVKKAFDEYAPGIPSDEKERETLLRRAFIPWLARVDETSGEVKRNVARWEEIPADARPLIEKLIEVRLLRSYQPIDKDGRPDPAQSRTVEPAHEALLRQWPTLVQWLKQEHANLMMLEAILRSAKEWDENGRSSDYIAHKGGRLQEARELANHDHYRAKVRGLPHTYLETALENETKQSAQLRRERIQKRTILATLLFVCIGAATLATLYSWTADRAKSLSKSRLLAQTTTAFQNNNPIIGATLAAALSIQNTGKERALFQRLAAAWAPTDNDQILPLRAAPNKSIIWSGRYYFKTNNLIYALPFKHRFPLTFDPTRNRFYGVDNRGSIWSADLGGTQVKSFGWRAGTGYLWDEILPLRNGGLMVKGSKRATYLGGQTETIAFLSYNSRQFVILENNANNSEWDNPIAFSTDCNAIQFLGQKTNHVDYSTGAAINRDEPGTFQFNLSDLSDTRAQHRHLDQLIRDTPASQEEQQPKSTDQGRHNQRLIRISFSLGDRRLQHLTTTEMQPSYPRHTAQGATNWESLKFAACVQQPTPIVDVSTTPKTNDATLKWKQWAWQRQTLHPANDELLQRHAASFYKWLFSDAETDEQVRVDSDRDETVTTNSSGPGDTPLFHFTSNTRAAGADHNFCRFFEERKKVVCLASTVDGDAIPPLSMGRHVYFSGYDAFSGPFFMLIDKSNLNVTAPSSSDPRLYGVTGATESVAVSPSSMQLATIERGVLRVFIISDGIMHLRVETPILAIGTAEPHINFFSESKLVYVTSDGQVGMIDVENKTTLWTFRIALNPNEDPTHSDRVDSAENHRMPVNEVVSTAFSGHSLIAVFHSPKVYVLDAETGLPLPAPVTLAGLQKARGLVTREGGEACKNLSVCRDQYSVGLLYDSSIKASGDDGVELIVGDQKWVLKPVAGPMNSKEVVDRISCMTGWRLVDGDLVPYSVLSALSPGAPPMSLDELSKSCSPTEGGESSSSEAYRIATPNEAGQVATADVNAVPVEPEVTTDINLALGKYSYAIKLYEKKDLESAEIVLSALTRNYPNDPISGDANFWAGEIAFKQKAYDRAAKAYGDALKLLPQSIHAPYAMLKLGMSLKELGLSKEACSVLNALPSRYAHASDDVFESAAAHVAELTCDGEKASSRKPLSELVK